MIRLKKYRQQNRTGKKIAFKVIGLLIVSLLVSFFTNSAYGQSQIFDYTGSNQTFTVPAGVTSVTVEAWGSGGAGGTRSGTGTKNSGGGGGGGGYRTYTYTGLTAGNTFTITIGQGGIVNGGDGNNTTVTLVSQTNLVASGGSGGSNGSNRNPGSGGSGGGTGSGPSGSSGTAGLAGSTGSSNGSGGNGGMGATTNGGAGGAGGANGSGNNAGIAGVPGGGGGGANNDGNSASNGAAGRVVMTYTCPSATISYSPSTFCKSVVSASVMINGSTGGSFSVAPSSGLTINSSGAINPSTSISGTYIVHYQFAGGNGCSAVDATATVKIEVPVATVSNQTNISCFGGANGTITVSANSGTSPYTFSIDNGATFQGATGTDLRQFTGLLANTSYTVKVKDTNGCISN